jgi:hypothetical protein
MVRGIRRPPGRFSRLCFRGRSAAATPAMRCAMRVATLRNGPAAVPTWLKSSTFVDWHWVCTVKALDSICLRGDSAMNTFHERSRAIGVVVAAVMLVPVYVVRAQPSDDQQRAARRQAILQQDQLFTEEGEIVYQDETRVPPPQLIQRAQAAPSAKRDSDPQPYTVYRPYDWRGHYYSDSRVRYYYTPPRARYYSRYPGYYEPYYGRAYYGYRGYYYGAPRFGYNDYPYGGTVRVGGFRLYWR